MSRRAGTKYFLLLLNGNHFASVSVWSVLVLLQCSTSDSDLEGMAMSIIRRHAVIIDLYCCLTVPACSSFCQPSLRSSDLLRMRPYARAHETCRALLFRKTMVDDTTHWNCCRTTAIYKLSQKQCKCLACLLVCPSQGNWRERKGTLRLVCLYHCMDMQVSRMLTARNMVGLLCFLLVLELQILYCSALQANLKKHWEMLPLTSLIYSWVVSACLASESMLSGTCVSLRLQEQTKVFLANWPSNFRVAFCQAPKGADLTAKMPMLV